MKRFFFLIVFCLLSCSTFAQGDNINKRSKERFPKICAVNYTTNLTKSEAALLAKFDLVVLHAENAKNRRKLVQNIKQKNPKVKLIAYFNVIEVWDAGSRALNQMPIQQKLAQLLEFKYRKFKLNYMNGTPTVYWSAMRCLNLSSRGPVVKGKQYPIFIADFIADQILSDPIWDGIMVDGTGDDFSFIPDRETRRRKKKMQLDLNGDGRAESSHQIDQWWREGVGMMLAHLRKRCPKSQIIGLEGNLFFKLSVQGKYFETYPNDYFGGWYGSTLQYMELSKTHPLTIANAHGSLKWPANQKSVRFGFTSALLGDGYFSYDDGTTHDWLYWYPPYNVDLGRPLGDAIRPQKKIGVVLEIDRTSMAKSDYITEQSIALRNVSSVKVKLSKPGTYRLSFKYQMVGMNSASVFSLQAPDKLHKWNRWPYGWAHLRINVTKPFELKWRMQGKGFTLLSQVEVWQERPGCWRREFEGGTVLCNPSGKSQAATVRGKRIVVPAKDGRMITK